MDNGSYGDYNDGWRSGKSEGYEKGYNKAKREGWAELEELKAVVWELAQQLGEALTGVDAGTYDLEALQDDVRLFQHDVANLLDLPKVKKWLKEKPSQSAIDSLYETQDRPR